MEDFRWLIELITGLVATATGWIVGRRQRNNAFLGELQSSIDALATKNSQQMDEILKLREQVIDLKTENVSQSKEITRLRKVNDVLKQQMTELRAENQKLSAKLNALTELRAENQELSAKLNALTEQLSGVKTITKSK